MIGSCLNGTELTNVAIPPRDRTGKQKKMLSIKHFRFIKLNFETSFWGNRKWLLTDIWHAGCQTETELLWEGDLASDLLNLYREIIRAATTKLPIPQ